MYLQKLTICNPPQTTFQKKYMWATYVLFLPISANLMASDNT